MAYTNLITIDELDSDAVSSLDVTGDVPYAAERAIEDVTALIEAHLDRKLIAREHLMLGRDIELEYDYDVSSDATSRYSFYAAEWPVLEAKEVTPEDFSLDVHPDERRFYTEIPMGTGAGRIRRVRYFAGYRRADQKLDDLPTGDGEALDGLSEEPPVLPSDIRRVAGRLALHVLTDAKKGTIGRRSVDYSLGDGNGVTVEGATEGFVQGELRKLDRHRSLAW